MEQEHYLRLLVQEVEDVIEEARCSPTYTAMLKQALSSPGGILSTSPRAQWGSLVLLSCHSASHGQWQHAILAAAAMEVFGAALETFDDLQDDDPLQPSVERVTLQPSVEREKSHLPNTACGLLVLSQRCVCRLASREGMADKAWAVADIVSGVGMVVGSGQHLDLLWEGRTDVTQDECLEIAAQKSAALVAGACRIGALLGTDDGELVERYAQFGWHAGMAAQLANDIDGVRPSGRSKSDIRRLKPTLPLAFFAEGFRSAAAGPVSLETLDEEQARLALLESGAIHYTWVIADLHRQKAEEILADIDRTHPARPLLRFVVSPDAAFAAGDCLGKGSALESQLQPTDSSAH